MAGKSRSVTVPEQVEGWRAEALCRNHPILPAAAWVGDRPERATRAAKARFDLEREAAKGFCLICPAQWECAIYGHVTGDRWNVCGADPLDLMAFRRAMKGRDVVLAFRAMEVEGIPVQDGVLLTLRRGDPSHVVVRSGDGTIQHVSHPPEGEARPVERVSGHL